MKKKILTGWTIIGIIFLLVIVNMLLPKDFSGYYRDIDMVREELSEIYDNGEFVYTQETEKRYTDFIVGEDVYIIRIKQKDTLFGPKYRMIMKEQISNFYKILEKSVLTYENSNKIYFTSIGWLDEWPSKPDENVLWDILPAEYLVTDLESNVSTHKFTYEGEEYVLYVKVEKIK